MNPSGTRAFGVDVSSNQGTGIDWNKVAAPADERRGGADVRVHPRNPRGYQRDIDDRGDAGGRFDVQLQHHQCETGRALDAGRITSGGRTCGRPGTPTGTGDAPGSVGTPEDEARHMLEIAGKYMKVGYMRPVYDLEDGGAEQNVNQMSNFVHRFANTLMKYKGPGAKIIVYAGQSYSVSEVNSSVSTYPLWMAAVAFAIRIPGPR